MFTSGVSCHGVKKRVGWDRAMIEDYEGVWITTVAVNLREVDRRGELNGRERID